MTLRDHLLMRSAAGRTAAAFCAVALAAGCGGDQGGSGGGVGIVSGPVPGVTPTPTPTPTPVPSPTPTPAAAMFGALSQTAAQQFALLGFGYRGVEVGGWGDMAVDPQSVDPALAIGLRDRPSQLASSIAGFGEGVLRANGGSGTDLGPIEHAHL